MRYIKLNITEEDKHKAEQRGQIIDKIHDSHGNNRKPFGNTNYRIVGKVGELKVHQFLINNDIHNTALGIRQDSQGNICDFIVSDKTIDVKTAQMKQGMTIDNITNKYNFFIGKQYMKQEIDYYVSCYVDYEVNNAYLVGYIDKDKASTYSITKTETMSNPAYSIPLNDLQYVWRLFNSLGYENTKDAQKTIYAMLC